ncbi:MAG: response regulator receiver modulated CheB methylesterase [Solirubrobacterales bacterium]|nr:response regulator receiver modulated CheB methylesterase [Solirubrobacterales bacterium]
MSVRVAICEDSRAYAQALKMFLETDGDLEVVGIAARGEDLLGDLSRLRPDLVTMDLELPGIDGVETIRRIMTARPTPAVVISGHVGSDARAVAAALDAGALEAIRKSDLRLDERGTPRAGAVRRRLARLATSAVGSRRTSQRSDAGVPVIPPTATVIGIGASTGGPRALRTVLGALPGDFPLPVLVVQHMAPGFTAGLATWLNDVVDLPVRLASEAEPLGPGVLIAPDDAHLLVTPQGRVRLDRRTPGNPHRPSVDMLLRSLAEASKRRAIGVVLTGMGADGAAGVEALLEAGGTAVTERAGDATLWAMPAAAADAGAGVLDLEAIGPALAAAAGRR